MGSFNFTLPGTSKSFTIKGPDGFTEAQARAIFDQQAAAGSLVGFKPGDILNAASQAAAGLQGAASQLSQTLAGIPGVGSTSLSSAAAAASSAVTKVASVATQTVKTVTDTIKSIPVTNGINVADYAKQIPSLTSIQNINPTQLTAGLSQASKLVGQTATQISNTLGAGQFGLTAQQLELAGVVKPGVATGLVAAGQSLVNVLKSPAVFTGKNGIGSIDDLLSSPIKQTAIQQQLMSTGANAIKQLGLPIDKLDPSAAVGTILNAAKSIPTTMDWAKGLPLPADIKTAFDQVAKDGAFATDLANQKINQAMKAEIVPIPAADTVNRETLNAASTRVVGNAKVPAVDYSNTPKLDVTQFTDAVNAASLETVKLNAKFKKIMNSTPDDQLPQGVRQLEQLVGDYNALDSKLLSLLREAKLFEKQLGFAPPQLETIESERSFIAKMIASLQNSIDKLKKIIENSAA